MPPPWTPCAECPGPGCLPERHRNVRLCDLARADPGYRALVLGRADPPPGEPTLPEWTYIPTARLLADTAALVGRLPEGIDLVAAVPRSGMIPGALLATLLHAPLYSISRQYGIQAAGHGGRLGGDRATPKHVLLVDDSAAFGREMAAARQMARRAWPGAGQTRLAVYCHPQARAAVDLCAALYPGSHYLEWNWPNAGHGMACGFDVDGLLTARDFTPEECRTDESYRAAMATIPPGRFLPRRAVVPLVCSARPESCRDLTAAWLDRHGVRAARLVLWRGPPHPPAGPVADWKAAHARAAGVQCFAESDPLQAAKIAYLAQIPVISPTDARVYPPGYPAP